MFHHAVFLLRAESTPLTLLQISRNLLAEFPSVLCGFHPSLAEDVAESHCGSPLSALGTESMPVRVRGTAKQQSASSQKQEHLHSQGPLYIMLDPLCTLGVEPVSRTLFRDSAGGGQHLCTHDWCYLVLFCCLLCRWHGSIVSEEEA